MLNLTDMAKRLIIAVIIMCFAITAGAFVFYFGDIEGFLRFALGLFLGSVCACARVVSMDMSVRKTIEQSSGAVGTQSFLVRYLFTAAVLVAAAVFDVFNLLAAVIGVLTLQPAAYIVPMIFRE